MGYMILEDRFVEERIDQIRKQKGVSESEMSFEMGKDVNYIHNIVENDLAMSMTDLLAICDYFEISVNEFFDDRIKEPILFHKAVEAVGKLNDDDLALLNHPISKLIEVNKIIREYERIMNEK